LKAVLVLSLIVLMGGLCAADPPHLVSFQGRLCDSQGRPLPDGEYSVTFAIYDVAEGGDPVWTEAKSVDLRGGVFGVVLGETTPLNLPFDRGYWVGIQVESDPEMQPRLRLVCAAYALNSDTVDTFHASSVPEAGKLLALDQGAKFPNAALHTGHGEGLDADTVDGYHAQDLMGSGGAYVELAPLEPQPGAAVNIEGDDLPLHVTNSAPTEEVKGLKISAGQSPTPRQSFAVCTAASDLVILFGGDAGSPKQDTWAYDAAGDSWTLYSPSKSPPARQEHAMAYDPVNGKVILFGGYSETGRVFLGDTWAFDPASGEWSQMSPQTHPPARSGHAMAYAGSGKVILFGGLYLDDTWLYDYAAQEWTELAPSQRPPGRYGHCLAYDSQKKEVVLFGGSGPGSNAMDDTWVFDPATDQWSQAEPAASPPGRSFAAMSFDSKLGETLLFGGMSEAGNVLSDFWAYNLADGDWREFEVDTGPEARRGHGMAFVASENVTVVFGGFDGTARLGDTWEVTLLKSGLAAYFAGSTYTTGNAYAYSRTGGACDLAELVPALEPLEPGDVVVIDGLPEPGLRRCDKACDPRAAGIVSAFPGYLMGVAANETARAGQAKLALAGRVLCKVDACYGAIHPGDLLVTSPTPGYAMRAEPLDLGGVAVYPAGAVVGKALEPMESGMGRIEALVMGR
jgi:hypothetical protein